MPTATFQIVAAELERHIGDILAVGVMKKALEKVGSDPDHASSSDLLRALDMHVEPALHSFMTKEMAGRCVKGIKRKLAGGAQNA